MMQYYCNLCGEEEIINTRKGVIYRHILEQHSGYGYKCQGCKKIYSARRDRGIRDVNTLMGRMSIP
jgi:transposase-like protein